MGDVSRVVSSRTLYLDRRPWEESRQSPIHVLVVLVH